VRELRHVAEYLVATATGDRVDVSDLPFGQAEPRSGLAIAPPADAPAPPPDEVPRRLADELEELECRRMAEALVAAGGVKARAARLLGMPIRTFTWKLRARRARGCTRPAHSQGAAMLGR
jgi:two-component system, NtrC family, response regulator AtoC